jgi:hypothetical protein
VTNFIARFLHEKSSKEPPRSRPAFTGAAKAATDDGLYPVPV